MSRVALLTYSTRPRGGVVHTLALAEALARTGEVAVTVMSLARGGDTGFFRPIDPRVDVRLAPFPDVPGEDVGARVLRSIAVLGDALAGLDADIRHAQDCVSANAAAGNCVRTVHHIDQFTTPTLATCHERALVGPHTHVCVSQAVAGELQLGWGIHAAVIPNGVEAERFAAAASEDPAAMTARTAWRARLGARFVLAVGGIEPRKGTLELVTAMAALRARGLDVPLVVAGGETLFDYRDYRTEVFTLAERLGVTLEVLGPVDHDALPALVAAASVEAFPSTKEGFGLAAMEALAAGVPLVCRDLPVLREVFRDAATFAADAGELAGALQDALCGRHPVAAGTGRALAAAHTWDDAAAAHLDLYGSL